MGSFQELADALAGTQIDVWGTKEAEIILVTHFHNDHAPYEAGRGAEAHLSECKSLAELWLHASKSIIDRYTQLDIKVKYSEDLPRLELPHPDVNNGKRGLPTAKTTSYIVGEVAWISETDANNLLAPRLDGWLRYWKSRRSVRFIAIPPEDRMHYLDRQSVNQFVQKLCGMGLKPFTYAHAFAGTEKWRRIVKYTDAREGIGISRLPPVGVPVIPQVARNFQDVFGGRYNSPQVGEHL